MNDTIVLVVTVLVLVAVSGYLIGTMIRSIRDEKRSSQLRKIWKNFGLSIALVILFLVSWGGQAVAEWGTYRHEQQDHEQPVEVSEYLIQFGQSTLENWQSEFLQLLTFVALSAVLHHKGSPEAKDSDEQTEAHLDRIEDRIAALEELLRRPSR
jgi:hypothetical protein